MKNGLTGRANARSALTKRRMGRRWLRPLYHRQMVKASICGLPGEKLMVGRFHFDQEV